MSQGRKRTEKRNEFKIYKSYPSSLESSRSKDDSTSNINSVSYSSGDQKTRHKNFHKSKKSHTIKSLKSPFVVRKDIDSNDSGFRRNSDYSKKHKTRLHHHQHHHHQHHHHHHHHQHENNFLNSKNPTIENPNFHQICHSARNKRGSESSPEEKSKIAENKHSTIFSSTEIHGFLNRFSLRNSFNSEEKEKGYSTRSSKCNHINDKRNGINDEEKEKNRVPETVSLDRNEEIIEEFIEGSARTRGFCFETKNTWKNIQGGRNNNFTKTENRNSIKLYDDKSFLKSYKISNENLNIDYQDLRKSRKRTKSQPERRRKSESSTESKNKSRKEKNVENSSKKSFESKLNKTKKTRKINNNEIKITAAKGEEILKSISSSTIESSFQSRKSQENSRKSSKDRHKKFKIKEGIQKSNIKLNSENDISEAGMVKNFINDSKKKIKDKKIRDIQERKKSKKKNQKRKGSRYKNSRPEFKRKTLRYLIYLIRKIILSDKEENKNDDRDNNIKISKKNSCIRIKQENKVESGCESSGYDSLKNIQDQISEINKNQNSETNSFNYQESTYLKNSSNEIEFLDTEKYCVYEIYKSTDGGILLKESQSQEFKTGEYVIGKRILKEPERILQFSKNTSSDLNQLFSQCNNSTQTEIDLTSSHNPRKKSWFRKSYNKKCQSGSKKYFTSLESASNSSFPESSDFEQFYLPFRQTKKIHSPSAKKSLSNIFKPSAHFFKKSTGVDTSDLIYFTSVHIPEDNMVLPLNNLENEKNLGYSEPKKENSATSLSDKTKLFLNYESIKRGDNFSSSIPSMIPVSWLQLDNTKFISQKINMEEMRVQMENNCNFIQSTEFQIKKPELLYLEGSSYDAKLRNKEKKSSRNFFRIFKKKKKYDRIRVEDEKLKMQ